MNRTALFIFISMLAMFNRNNEAGDDTNGERIRNAEVKNNANHPCKLNNNLGLWRKAKEMMDPQITKARER